MELWLGRLRPLNSYLRVNLIDYLRHFKPTDLKMGTAPELQEFHLYAQELQVCMQLDGENPLLNLAQA